MTRKETLAKLERLILQWRRTQLRFDAGRATGFTEALRACGFSVDEITGAAAGAGESFKHIM